MTAAGLAFRVEDPLSYLPRSTVIERARGQLIYGATELGAEIFLVLSGKVTVTRRTATDRRVLVDIYHTDEFFGENCILHAERRGEEAMALELSRLMSWTSGEIEEAVLRRPRLGVALAQLMARRNTETALRVESLAVEKIEQRLARALLRFSDKFGETSGDGSVRLFPLTHELLAEYVGTSREIVTHYMTGLRRRGSIRYSRKGIDVYSGALREWLAA
ncbi:MAG: Crp/Fnr family transcriptional regulator [Bryobacteraceae bacterium]